MEESSDIKQAVTPEFVEKVRKYINLDDQLKELKNNVKKISHEKDSIETYILEYLSSINEISIDINNGKLKRNITKVKSGIKKEYIQDTLMQYVNDNKQVNTIINKIIDSIPIKEKISLKRLKN